MFGFSLVVQTLAWWGAGVLRGSAELGGLVMDVATQLQEWDEAVWRPPAALAVVLDHAPSEHRAAAEQVIAAVGRLEVPPQSTTAQARRRRGCPAPGLRLW